MAKILIVDDEEPILSLLQDFLIMSKLECRGATNVQEAQKCLDEEDFDLILSDYLMPGETGIDLLRYVMIRGAATPFILFSGSCDERVKDEAFQNGASAVIEKPISLTIVLRTVLTYLNKGN